MIKPDEKVIMKAIAICFKPFLKPEEALIYCNLERTQFSKKCEELGVFKNDGGYFSKEDLDLICRGGPSKYQASVKNIKIGKR
ncbi:MAG: hypothetical protein E6Q24_01385 [Chitinophagaceae bacterium]|nr:MAG: hypothetical protein E6Q24_01385 [Chitinophagaceae bacterium]